MSSANAVGAQLHDAEPAAQPGAPPTLTSASVPTQAYSLPPTAELELRQAGDRDRDRARRRAAAGRRQPRSLDSLGRNRWGDYPGIAADPQDPDAVWMAGEYVSASNVWSTWISQTRFAGAGLSFYTVPPCGIPGAARVVSLNVTAVSPSANGNVTLWPAGLDKPATSVANFAAGTNRSNNAPALLATDGSGRLSAQAFLADGGTVHLLLDVNGYFQ